MVVVSSAEDPELNLDGPRRAVAASSLCVRAQGPACLGQITDLPLMIYGRHSRFRVRRMRR